MDFTKVPLEDVMNFLRSYQQPIPRDRIDIRNSAINLINTNSGLTVPVSIYDFVTAFQLLNKRAQIPLTLESEIITRRESDLINLAQQLSLNYPDRERMIRILDYLGKLVNDIQTLEELPTRI